MSSWSTLVATPKTPALEQAQQLELVKYTAPAQPDTTDSSIPERTVITSESRGLIYGSGTTGFRTWEAALHLGSFLATKMGESLIRGKRVIELGAGTGFLSLLCARHLGAHTVVATDRETTLIENMDRCASHNQIGIAAELPFSPAVWEWGTPLDVKGGDAVSEWNQFDVALGADLVCFLALLVLLFALTPLARSTTRILCHCCCPRCRICSTIMDSSILSSPRPCATKIPSGRF